MWFSLNWIIWDISSYPIILYSTFCYLDSIMQIFYVYEWRNYLGVQKESINCLVAKSLHMSGSLFWDVEKSFASIHVTFILIWIFVTFINPCDGLQLRVVLYICTFIFTSLINISRYKKKIYAQFKISNMSKAGNCLI